MAWFPWVARSALEKSVARERGLQNRLDAIEWWVKSQAVEIPSHQAVALMFTLSVHLAEDTNKVARQQG